MPTRNSEAPKIRHKVDFRYIATVLHRDPTGFDLYDEKVVERRFEKRKDAEKWLRYEKRQGALTKLNIRPAYYRNHF